MGIDKVNMLTDDQRARAYHYARIQIVGSEPTPPPTPELVDFLRNAESILPPNISRLITGLSIFGMIAAFIPSAIRLHAVGITAFMQSVDDTASIYVAALCIVLMAEIGQIIFSLAMANTKVRWQQFFLLVGAVLSTGFALSGNAVAVGDYALRNLFTVLETYGPPIIVLILAQVLKTQILHSIEGRHVAKREYAQAYAEWERRNQDARRDWREAYKAADTDADWKRESANALRDALRRANGRSTAIIRSLTPSDWLWLVQREWEADQWYVKETQRRKELSVPTIPATPTGVTVVGPRRSTGSGSHTGEATGYVQSADNHHVATCPHCGWTKTYGTVDGAQNGLNVHIGRYCKSKSAYDLHDVGVELAVATENGNGHK